MRNALVLLAGAVFLLGCRTEIDVSVLLDDDGSGTVTATARLDADAVLALGGVDAILLDDVRLTGWEVTGPTQEDDGSVAISGSRGFADSAELQAVLDDVAGKGVFTDALSDVEQSFGRTTQSASVDVTVTGDPAQFSDAALTEVLGGLPLGRTAEELVSDGVTEPGAGTLTVSVALPAGESDTADLDLTGGEPESVTVSTEETTSAPLVFVLAGAAVLLALAAAVLAVVALVRRRS